MAHDLIEIEALPHYMRKGALEARILLRPYISITALSIPGGDPMPFNAESYHTVFGAAKLAADLTGLSPARIVALINRACRKARLANDSVVLRDEGLNITLPASPAAEVSQS